MASTASNPMVLHSYQATARVPAGAPGEPVAWKLPFACRSDIPQIFARRPGNWTLGVVRSVLMALVFGSAVAATASEPGRSGEREDEAVASLGSDGLIAAWAAVFAALSVLYAYERTREPGRNLVTRPAVPHGKLARDAAFARRLIVLHGAVPPGTRDGAVKPAVASSRPRFASPSKAKSASERPVKSAARKRRGGQAKAGEKATPAREGTTPAREKIGLGATQSGEETFSVAEAASGDAHAAPASAPLPPPAPAAASGASFVSAPASTAAVDRPDYVQLCGTLRSRGRFAEAARLARDGLAVAGDPGLLLVELSRAELGLGRVNAAIDIARDAHFASPSRESVVHLIQLLTETRRFTREDGPSLRRAVGRHPRQPLLLQAMDVFESMYGKDHEMMRPYAVGPPPTKV